MVMRKPTKRYIDSDPAWFVCVRRSLLIIHGIEVSLEIHDGHREGLTLTVPMARICARETLNV